MHLIEIDEVRTEAPEAVLAPLRHVLARETLVIRAFSHRKKDLRGKHDIVAYPFYRPTGDLLGDTLRVDVGGVHEVTARLEKSADDCPGSLLVGLPPEGHTPQAQLGDHQPRISKTPVLHGYPPLLALVEGLTVALGGCAGRWRLVV